MIQQLRLLIAGMAPAAASPEPAATDDDFLAWMTSATSEDAEQTPTDGLGLLGIGVQIPLLPKAARPPDDDVQVLDDGGVEAALPDVTLDPSSVFTAIDSRTVQDLFFTQYHMVDLPATVESAPATGQALPSPTGAFTPASAIALPPFSSQSPAPSKATAPDHNADVAVMVQAPLDPAFAVSASLDIKPAEPRSVDPMVYWGQRPAMLAPVVQPAAAVPPAPALAAPVATTQTSQESPEGVVLDTAEPKAQPPRTEPPVTSPPVQAETSDPRSDLNAGSGLVQVVVKDILPLQTRRNTAPIPEKSQPKAAEIAASLAPAPPWTADLTAGLQLVPAAENLDQPQTAATDQALSDLQGFTSSPRASDQLRPQLVAPANLSHQFLQHAATAIERQVEVVLSPEELGSVKFQIRHHGEAVTILLSAERAETMEMLRRHSDELMREFRQAGFSGATLDFGQWGQQSQSQPQAQTGFVLSEDFVPAAPTPRPSQRLDQQGHTSGLNIRL